MKSLLSLCIVCLVVTLVGCKSDKSTDAGMSVSPGAVGEENCTGDCGSCTGTCDKADASMGAVGEKSCTGTCDKADASMGAVSDSAKTCTGAKSCDGAKSDASMGAVSDKSHCSGSGTCPYAGSKTDG